MPPASWSPDGARILFHADRRADRTVYNIYVPDLASGQQTRGTPDLEEAFDGMPSWSPDGSSILFHSDRTGNFDIWIMSSDGTHLRRLTTGRGHDVVPRWSPDGSQIVFYSDRQGNVCIDRSK